MASVSLPCSLRLNTCGKPKMDHGCHQTCDSGRSQVCGRLHVQIGDRFSEWTVLVVVFGGRHPEPSSFRLRYSQGRICVGLSVLIPIWSAEGHPLPPPGLPLDFLSLPEPLFSKSLLLHPLFQFKEFPPQLKDDKRFWSLLCFWVPAEQALIGSAMKSSFVPFVL